MSTLGHSATEPSKGDRTRLQSEIAVKEKESPLRCPVTRRSALWMYACDPDPCKEKPRSKSHCADRNMPLNFLSACMRMGIEMMDWLSWDVHVARARHMVADDCVARVAL